MNEDLISLLKKNDKKTAVSEGETLKVLIVDDEPTVHDITALVLKNFRYRGYKLELRSAYSAAEAREVLASDGPFALILLDVIMETDDAGLTLARYIREELKDQMVRIILRTGQPGMVPQRQVMREYEIDDYKEKAELTSERFDATVTASIRTYLGFMKLEQNRQGLIRILDAIRDVENSDMGENMANHILGQIESVMSRSETAGMGSLLISLDEENHSNTIVSSRGSLKNLKNKSLDNLEDRKTAEIIRGAIEAGTTQHDSNHIMTTLLTRNGGRYLAYFEDVREFGDMEHYLVELYASHVNISLDNKMLNQELVQTQKEIISTLGEVIETRSGETGQHVRRVGEIARLLADHLYSDTSNKELLMFATPLHDIGKVGISDSILNKPGKLTADEFEQMKDHSRVGYEILKSSNRPVLKMGARICLEHHERWDGKGYPAGLSDENISIEARICSIADVLDALCSKRPYKDAMPLPEALEIIGQGRATQFDPTLVDILLSHRGDIETIYRNLQD